MPAGTDYFKKGAAAAQMASRKAGEYAIMVLRYGELGLRIQHMPAVQLPTKFQGA